VAHFGVFVAMERVSEEIQRSIRELDSKVSRISGAEGVDLSLAI
jgi:hypothetical protein